MGKIDKIGKSEKVEKKTCRRFVGRIDKMDFFLGKVKKWKKQSAEAQADAYSRLKDQNHQLSRL